MSGASVDNVVQITRPMGPSRGSTNTSTDRISDYYRDIPQINLLINEDKLEDLKVDEGTKLFAFWFAVSAYLPLFTACLCSLANMVSIAALTTSWTQTYIDGVLIEIVDPKVVSSLNAVSLALGAVGNISVFLNFNKILNYRVSQVVSIFALFVASLVLVVALLLLSFKYKRPDAGFTEGFWFGVLTCALYASCAVTCFLNFLGYLLDYYSPDFNLDRSERGLIIYTFILAIWFSWGSAVFSVVLGISYSNGLYFCVQTLLTIGFGDIPPKTDLARGLTILYAVTGFVIIALIVVLIKSTVGSANNPVLYWNQVEIRRKEALKKARDSNVTLSPKDSFDIMRAVKKSARRRQSNINTCFTIIIWLIFWMFGSVIFYFTEEWSFFTALYFCFLCWLTIGYGDVVPTSSAGRSFFVIWALTAVPLMTALISDVGERLYIFSNREIQSNWVKWLFNRSKKAEKKSHVLEVLRKNITGDFAEDDEDNDDDSYSIDNDTRTVEQIITSASRDKSNPSQPKSELDKVKELISNARQLIVEAKNEPKKKYEYDYWRTILSLMEFEDEEREVLGLNVENFWLTEESPLRFPISEPDYILFFVFNRLESLVLERLKELEKYEQEDPAYQLIKKKK